MNFSVAKVLSTSLALLWSSAAASASQEDMRVVQQVALSPAHKVAPYSITQASNGDFIVAGADNNGNYRAWATRVTKKGEPIWEFLDGSPDGWTDYSQNDQRFYGAVDLPNGNTLLCGIKRVETKIVAFLVRLGPDGKLIDERVLRPAHEGFPGSMTCVALDDGVALLAGLAGTPIGGWFTKLDGEGNFLWEKFGDQFGSTDAMPTQSGSLYSIGGNEVRAVDRQGNLLARYRLPGSEQRFIHPVGQPSRVRISSMISTLETVILDFDLDLQKPPRKIRLDNIGPRVGLESANRVTTIFGSRYFNGATAGAARVYPSGDSKMFTVEPRFKSLWFYDAVAIDSVSGEFATVRNDETGRGVITWISFK